jgi:hypothetical protein
VCENRVLRGIFRLTRKEVAGGWRRLHNEELHNLYASLNILSVTNSENKRLAVNAEHMGYMCEIHT